MTKIKFAALLHKARVLAGENVEMAEMQQADAVDTNEMTREEKVAYATLARLQRIVDKHADAELNDHLVNIQNVQSADRAVDAYTEDYLLDLDLSYDKLMELAQKLSAACNKYGVAAPLTWQQMAQGQFDYDKELNYPE